jgi:hypothetical protein
MLKGYGPSRPAESSCRLGNLRSENEKILKVWDQTEAERTTMDVILSIRLAAMKGRLRTLKDVEIFSPPLKGNIVCSRVLREEAMRHVKRQQVSPDNKEVVEWIKHFFNLTDVETS